MSLSYNYPPQYAYPSGPPMYRSFPPPPRLHWGWVLLLSILTLGIFDLLWMVVQANWVKKVAGYERPFWWTLAYLIFHCLVIAAGIAGYLFAPLLQQQDIFALYVITVQEVGRWGGLVLWIVCVFMLEGGLDSPPINIPLSGFMTFFFGPLYFQYHLQNYSVEGKVGEQVSGFAEPAAADAGALVSLPEVPPQV